MAEQGVNIPVNLEIEDASRTAESLGRKISEAINKNIGTTNSRLAKVVQDLTKIKSKVDVVGTSIQNNTSLYNSMQKKVQDLTAAEHAALVASREQEESLAQRGAKYANLVKRMKEYGYNEEQVRAGYFGKNKIEEGSEFDEQIKILKELHDEWAKASEELEHYNGLLYNMDNGTVEEQAGILQDLSDKVHILLLKMNEIEGSTEDLGNTGRTAGNSFRSSFYLARTILNDVGRSIQRTKDRFKSFVMHIAEATKHMFQLRKSSDGLFKSLTNGFKHALRNIMRYGFGIRSLYFLFRRLRTYAKDALGEMAKQIPEVNRQMSRATQALNQMKGALGTAFQPLLNILIPALEKLAALVTKVANALASLFAMFTGQKTIMKATAGATDYAASLKGTGKAAKDAKKELEGYLSPIDEINKYQSKRDDADDAGGGGAGGGGLTFEEAPIDPKWLDWWEKIKKAWENADFFDIGKELGDKIAEALANIPWDKIKNAVRRLAKSLATLLNGMMSGEWDGKSLGYWIGRTLAEAINTAFEFVNQFAKSFDWGKLGQTIVDAITGVFKNLDWNVITEALGEVGLGLGKALATIFDDPTVFAEAGEALGRAINALVDMIYNFLNQQDGEDIGNALIAFIGTAVDTIDVNDISATIAKFVNLVTTTISTLFGSTPIDLKDRGFSASIENYEPNVSVWVKLSRKLGTLLKDTIEQIDWEMLGRAIGGVLQAAIDFVKDFFEEQDFNSIKQACADLLSGFFASVDEKDMAKLIGLLVAGAVGKGVATAIKFILAKKFGVAILGAIFGKGGSGAGAGASVAGGLSLGGGIAIDVFTQIAAAASIVLTAIDQVKHGISLMNIQWSSLGHLVMGFWYNYNPLVGTALQAVATTIAHHWDEIKQTTSQKWEDFKSNIMPKITNFFGNIISFIVNVFTGNWKNAWTDITNVVKNAWDAIKAAWNKITSIVDKIKAKFTELKSHTKSIGDAIKGFFTSWGNSIKQAAEGIKGIFRSVGDSLKSMWNGIVDKINGDHTIGTLSFPVHLPHLAQGAVLPANKPFMAMVGDQKNGTNIETPLDTMIEAFNRAMANNGGGTTTINFVLPDRRKVAQYVLEGGKIIQTSTGNNPFQLA